MRLILIKGPVFFSFYKIDPCMDGMLSRVNSTFNYLRMIKRTTISRSNKIARLHTWKTREHTYTRTSFYFLGVSQPFRFLPPTNSVLESAEHSARAT